MNELEYKKESFYDRFGNEELAKAFEYAKGYMAFLDAAKTEREAVKYAIAEAKKQGFVPYSFGDTPKKGGKYYVNLKALNALALQEIGVQNIEISHVCTFCQHDRYWSHRYTRGERGSQGAFILRKEEQL